MTERYDAVIYDLDGTLVRLNVDWDDAHRDVVAKLRAHDIDFDGEGLWELFERASEEGFELLVEETLAEHERQGAWTSKRLPLADELPHTVPVGVCSLNCEAACRVALDTHALGSYVDVIVGRDTVDPVKPDPGPLLSAARELSVTPDQSLFIGDSERDAVAADRAGMDVEYVSERV